MNNYIKEFEKWLKNKNLSTRTVNKHLNYIELFIEDYLVYYEGAKIEDGVCYINSFLGDWFIRKCVFSTRTSLMDSASSIKQFYKFMSEKNYVEKKYYQKVCEIIKNNMNKYLEELDEYDALCWEEW